MNHMRNYQKHDWLGNTCKILTFEFDLTVLQSYLRRLRLKIISPQVYNTRILKNNKIKFCLTWSN